MTAPTTTPARVDRLADQAADAAAIRALTTHPDVIALRVERVRAQVDALLWAGIVLGLAFTMVNVQTFAAAGADRFTAGWWVAWLLDPMVSLVLLAVLRAEQVTARYQVALPAWGRRTKWLTFAATYAMNTWTSWGLAGAPLSWSGVVLHSVPPLVVFATAETGPGLRDRLTEAVRCALTEHAVNGAGEGSTGRAAPAPVTAEGPVREQAAEPVREPVTEPVPAVPARPVGRRKARRPVPRRLLADYLTDARAALDTARAAGERVEVSPSWCRQVTGCSAGTSVKLAATLRADADQTPPVPTAVPSDFPSRNGRRGAGEEVAA
ncbi:hypothetical protein [Pseudonocardia sp. D17]|uniref:hypothetical protein n=1 Tax=Pseudonocardia sp. D17 TaxID=882661 RepID=UPI002B383BCC|nr:hypothetical protein PSD17_62230 [Pseudonocardia sp. D17]